MNWDQVQGNWKQWAGQARLTRNKLPTRITTEPAVPMIKRGETKAKLVLTETEDAALSSFEIPVTGHPTQGSDARGDLKLIVAAK